MPRRQPLWRRRCGAYGRSPCCSMPPAPVGDALCGVNGCAEICVLHDIATADTDVQGVARRGGIVLGRRGALADRPAEGGPGWVLGAPFAAARLIVGRPHL